MSTSTSPATKDTRDERFTLAYWTEINSAAYGYTGRELAEQADVDLARWTRSHAMGVRWAKDHSDVEHSAVVARASARHAFSTKAFREGFESVRPS